MEDNINLANAAIVGENPETAFVVNGTLLHAVDSNVADFEKDNSDPEQVVPLLRNALQALIEFADRKVPPHFIEMGEQLIMDESDDKNELINKIEQIFTHLPRHERQHLSSMIHHRQT